MCVHTECTHTVHGQKVTYIMSLSFQRCMSVCFIQASLALSLSLYLLLSQVPCDKYCSTVCCSDRKVLASDPISGLLTDEDDQNNTSQREISQGSKNTGQLS